MRPLLGASLLIALCGCQALLDLEKSHPRPDGGEATVCACDGVKCGETNVFGGACRYSPDPGEGCTGCTGCTGVPCGFQNLGETCGEGSGCLPSRTTVVNLTVTSGADDLEGVGHDARGVRTSSGAGEATGSNFKVQGLVVTP